MALAFNNTGDYAKAVYGDQQHAGPNGSIAMSSPSAPVTMRGGQNKRGGQSKQNKQNKRYKQSKRGGQSKRNNRKNKSQRKN